MMTCTTFRTQREALAAARESRQLSIDCGLPVRSQHILLSSGNTITLRADGSTIRSAGHISCGMWIDPTDLPCLVSE